jgi:hypothetical protein
MLVIGAKTDLAAVWQQIAAWPAVVAVAALLLVLAAAWAAHWFWQARRLATAHCPRRLLHQLCVAHRLRRSERQLIERLVKQHGLAHPALVFLEPALSDPASLGAFGNRNAARLIALQRQIFASE